ncbi:MAG: TlpA family protein disulfide reductase, partial [Bacteroidia bacterium]
MKKLLLLAVVAASLAGMMQSCKPDSPDGGSTASLTVAKKQRSLVVYHTATWCGPCGLYAMPEFKKLVAANDIDNIVPVDYHSSSSSRLVPLWTKAGNDTLFIAPFASQLLTTVSNIDVTTGQYSIPTFWLNNSLIGSSNIKVGDIQNNAVTANSNPVEIGVAASASASGQTLNIKYKLKAFAPEAGSDYYVSAFIVEKSVNTLQTVSGSGDVATDHERVIRASALTNAAGAPTAFSTAAIMTSPAANAEVEKT